MESLSNLYLRKNPATESVCKVLTDRETVQVEMKTNHPQNKSNGKDKKDGKIIQEKKNVTINVDLLKAAFLALGQLGPGGQEEDKEDQEINVSFTDLSYSIKKGIKREAKLILNSIHGEFRAGELTAIVGPSGSGKSSLLNILAGFTTMGVTGSIKINYEERDLDTFARRSCYIMQNDELSPLLTAEEAITVAANLKLGSKVSREKKPVRKILESLGLLECRQVLTSKLSGGQRKRLAIALELVSNPPVMFLDEPTSGLDSSSSKQCVTLLKKLAESGRTVVCILHQPSATLFEMIDHLYVMREGYCMYSGDTKKLLLFLAEHGLRCPHYHNPADFVLEIATMNEYKSQVSELVEKIKNGKSDNWRKNSEKSGLITENKQNDAAAPMEETPCALMSPGNMNHRSRFTRHIYPTSFWRQFSVILNKNFKKISRNMVSLVVQMEKQENFLLQIPISLILLSYYKWKPSRSPKKRLFMIFKMFTHLQLFAHFICGILIGFLFYDIGNDAAFVFDNFGFQFFCLMWIMFTSYSSAVSFYPQERPILVREHFNKWYSLKAYFFATNLANLPLQILCTMVFTTISYFMTSQPLEIDRFFKFSLIAVLVSFVGQGFGYLVGAAMNVQNAAIFGALLIAPFLLFSGYFVLLVDSPNFLQWLFHISYYKYALEGVMDAVFGNNRHKMNCSGDYCHYIMPDKFLKQLGMDCVDYWLDFSVLLGLSIFLRVLSYFVLRFRLNYLRG